MACTTESKKGFLIYASALEAMKNLSDSEFRECVEKMANYAMNDVEERGSVPIVDVILTMAYPNLDAARKHHDWAIENGKKGAPYGKNGGRPRKDETKEEYDKRKALEKEARTEQKTPKKPLNINIDNNIDIDINKDKNRNIDIDKKTDIEKEINTIDDSKSIISNNINQFSNSSSIEKLEDDVNECEQKSDNDDKKAESQAVASCITKEEDIDVVSRCNNGGEERGSADLEAGLFLAIQAAKEEREAILNSKGTDNYTEEACKIIEENEDAVYGWVQCLLNDKSRWLKDSARQHLLEVLKGCNGNIKEIARNLVEYSLRREEAERIKAEERETKRESGNDLLDAITLGTEYDYSGNPVADFAWEQEIRMRQNLNR